MSARKRNAEAAQDPDAFTREWLRWVDESQRYTPAHPLHLPRFTQEPDMTAKTRHDELVALLSKISEESVTTSNVLADMLDLLRERLPERTEVKVAPFDPDVIARNLAALKHEVETPMREHGECCEPAEVTEDQPVGTYLADCDDDVWVRRASGWHIWSDWLSAWGSRARAVAHLREHYAPLRLATPADLARVGIEDDPRPDSCCGKCPPIVGGGYDCTCDGNPRCAKAGTPDDLPGEPVEPGDLRAGDRVEFTWEGARFACTLVSVHDGIVLRSDTPDSDGFTTNVVWGRKWASGISDVRLIERAPREGEGSDEARVCYSDECGEPCQSKQERDRDEIARLGTQIGLLSHRLGVERKSRKKVKAERDALRERLDALREDVERFIAGDPLITPLDILARDDERAAKGGQR